jgi:hypothetical protein
MSQEGQTVEKIWYCSKCLRKDPPVQTQLTVPETTTKYRLEHGQHWCHQCNREAGHNRYLRSKNEEKSAETEVISNNPNRTPTPTSSTTWRDTISKLGDMGELLSALTKQNKLAMDYATLLESETERCNRNLEKDKVELFLAYLKEAAKREEYEWKIMKRIFYDNKIYAPLDGFTLREMAFVCKQHFGLKKSVVEIERTVNSWIRRANEDGARIHPTSVNGKSRYHILRDPEDGKKQLDSIDTIKQRVQIGKDKRLIEVDEVTKEKEQSNKQKILVDAEGHSTTESEQREGGEQ